MNAALNVALRAVLAAGCGYLLGSVSFAYLFVRLRGKDLRREGTGHLGALNARRAAGWGMGALAGLCDLGKGVLAAVLGAALAPATLAAAGPPLGAMAGFLGVVLGHNYSCFLKGAGGKGLAASIGALLYISWPTLLATGAFGLVASVASGNMYIAASATACAMPAALAAFRGAGAGWPLALAVAAVVLSRHARDLAAIARGGEGGGRPRWRRRGAV